MNKIEVFKGAAKLVVSVGVGAIVQNAVTFTTPVMAIGVFKQAAIGVGTFVLGAMASEKASEYTDEKIDQALEELRKIDKPNK